MVKFIHGLDTAIYNVIYSLNSETLNVVMITITNIASSIILILLAIASYFVLKDKKISQYIMLNLGIAFILSRILKLIFSRERPQKVMQLVHENGYSFPSAHTLIGVAFYGFIIYLIYKKVDNKKVKITSITLLTLMLIMIGISRIYLGAHYATDVIGGVIFAIIYLFLFIKFIYNKD